MRIKWFGHAAFLLTADDGTRIITDPYVPGSFSGAVRYGPIRDEAAFVTVSHHHQDHDGVGRLRGKPVVFEKSGAHRAGAVAVRGVDSCHDEAGGAQRGPNVIFVFASGGLRVCHLGDLGHVPSEQAKAIGRVDVLLAPVGGTFTIGPRRAHRTAELLGAKVVIPMHYKTEKLGFEVAGVEEFVRGRENVKHVGACEVEVTADSLPASPEVWVLKHAL
ncbi:MBL fold metallo-hydrolase [candidate division WOR-3 bacterium]|nr:MBL fold metallo-hydrolase [candidate division WOR-3 bacterium]